MTVKHDSMYTMRINKEIKEKAEIVARQSGLSLSGVVKALFIQMSETGAIPFDIRLTQNVRYHAAMDTSHMTHDEIIDKAMKEVITEGTCQMILLTTQDILRLHEGIIQATGGESGIRDLGMIDSAVNSIYGGFDDVELYPSIEEKAARLCFGLIVNHGFVDGNKRIGTVAMLVSLKINGINMAYTDSELTDLILKVAKHESAYDEILEWIHQKEC